jgi:hypothetical protein
VSLAPLTFTGEESYCSGEVLASEYNPLANGTACKGGYVLQLTGKFLKVCNTTLQYCGRCS